MSDKTYADTEFNRRLVKIIENLGLITEKLVNEKVGALKAKVETEAARSSDPVIQELRNMVSKFEIKMKNL